MEFKIILGSISPVHANLWEIQFFPAANSASPPPPDPHDWAGLNQYRPQSKFCTMLYKCTEFLLYVLGAKDKKKSRVRQTPIFYLLGKTVCQCLIYCFSSPNLSFFALWGGTGPYSNSPLLAAAMLALSVEGAGGKLQGDRKALLFLVPVLLAFSFTQESRMGLECLVKLM